jgi:hypothetical protein
MRADGIAQAHGIPLSAQCAPTASLPACCACESLRHLEWFHDHVRVESMLFDVPQPDNGMLRPA